VDITILEEVVRNLIGRYVWYLILTIILAIPGWIILTSIKDWWVLRSRRNKLINDTILSLDSYYEIAGKKGKLKQIGKRWIKLEEDDTIHYISLESALKGPITKLKNFDE